jgi:hypothetical protein
MNYELGRIWNEGNMAYFNATSQYVTGKREKA